MINKYGHLQNTVTQLLCNILHEESEKPTVQNKSRPQLIGENKKNQKIKTKRQGLLLRHRCTCIMLQRFHP